MRLEQYLTEELLSVTSEEMIALIKRDCKPFLKEFRGTPPLFRGIKNEGSTYITKNVRHDRKPRNMVAVVSEKLDGLFKERFGWKPRSEGLFCSKDPFQPTLYGVTYVIFPIGSYKYIYSEKIVDLLCLNLSTFEDDDELYAFISDNYKTNGLAKSHTQGEVMIKCDKYYGIKSTNPSMSSILEEL